MERPFRYDVPEELVEEILLRLPPKSLLRLKSVCKCWNTLISDQYFVNKHLKFSINKAKNPGCSSSASLVLGWTRWEPHSIADFFYTTDDDDDDEDDEIDKVIDPDFGRRQVLSLVSACNKLDDSDYLLPSVVEEIYLPLIPDVEVKRTGHLAPIAGSHCNGIICLIDFSPYIRERVVFYNPALREHKLIHTKRFDPLDFEYHYLTHGFGYDSKANDYKFVRILSNWKDVSYKAEVYTLGTDSWSDIQIQLNEKMYFVLDQGVYLEGLYYWIFPKSIFSFDMCEDKFSSIPRPNEDPDAFLVTLAVWNGSLVCFSRLGAYDWYAVCYEMWVMANNNGDNGGGVTWTKHLSIGPLARITYPLSFLNEEELLMVAGDGRIVSYNIRTAMLRKLPIRGATLGQHIYADSYVQSLVSVKSRVVGKEPKCFLN